MLQKYAFACGGGYNHRIGLFDRVMLKDNHLAVAGATGGSRLTDTVALAKATCPDLPIEVEVDRLDQVEPVLEAGADIILLDNFSLTELREALATIDGRACTEPAAGSNRNTATARRTGARLHFHRRTGTSKPLKDIGLDWRKLQ